MDFPLFFYSQYLCIKQDSVSQGNNKKGKGKRKHTLNVRNLTTTARASSLDAFLGSLSRCDSESTQYSPYMPWIS